MGVIAVLGSRNPDGQTATAVDALLQGINIEEAESQRVFLPGKQVERCRQCGHDGWGTCRTEGRCSIDDDFSEIIDQIRAADLVVFATPVYFGDLSESLRAFLDRLRRVCWHGRSGNSLKGKPAIGVCVAGGGGGGAPGCVASLERILQTCGFDVVDMIPVRRQNLDLKKIVLKTTGQWLAANIITAS